MIALAPWQALLDGLGWVVAQIYGFIPNYGVTIILLTIVIRLVLLPLGIKQVRSMQHMQIVQPRIKQVQAKYKGNKQRQQEEIMKLYKEYGVNPFSGCWPVLLQFPILIAMYSILRPPSFAPVTQDDQVTAYEVSNNHLPTDSDLFRDSIQHTGTEFLLLNLQCTPSQAWAAPEDALVDTEGKPVEPGKPLLVGGQPVDDLQSEQLNCGDSRAAVIPYAVILILMTGTTYYQQRQMQRATPAGASSQQQQLLLRIFPLMFLVFGVGFPAGLILYWTTSNAWQIGQQYFMLKTRPTAEEMAERAKAKPQKAEKKGFMASMMERAEQQRKLRGTDTPRPGEKRPRNPKPGSNPKGSNPKGSNPKGSNPAPGANPKQPGSGGNGRGGDPKKRPKR
jgi:YidC/Oxa1 family membrane protein insertase